MADTNRAGASGFIQDFASRLRYPQLFFALAALFVLDLIIPDVIPFADEILLGLLTVLAGRLKAPRRDPAPAAEKPPEKNVTPPGGHRSS